MNRLILIGNGFDLAHGMKTSYNDFILWYLKKCYQKAFEKDNYEDILIQITVRRNFLNKPQVDALIEKYVQENLKALFFNDELYLDEHMFYNPFGIKMQSKLFEVLVDRCRTYNWVDIENEFYQELKDILLMIDPIIPSGFPDLKKDRLNNLNNSLTFIIEQLQQYLKQLDLPQRIDAYTKIFKLKIFKKEICTKIMSEDEEVNETLVLNFNYTITPQNYISQDNINYIHGHLYDQNNPLIFGFGDEFDSDYPKLELQKENEYFEYIKSFWYFKTSNYHNLVRFIDKEEFQVYILGHSCDLSDRTMLNMIFEHENCKSIKIFYHGNKEKNNYTNLTQEISRHFRDKAMMRKKIVPFDKSEPMPQVNPQ